MERQEKDQIIKELNEKFQEYSTFYITDTSALNSGKTSELRRVLFSKGIQLQVAKNTLIQKALEATGKDFGQMVDVLKGTSAIMFSQDAKAPAKVIKEFRKKSDKPTLKAAYAMETIFVGDAALKDLESIKSKNELIGDVIGMLQSPAQNVISALQSGGNKIAGILKTLEERSNA